MTYKSNSKSNNNKGGLQFWKKKKANKENNDLTNVNDKDEKHVKNNNNNNKSNNKNIKISKKKTRITHDIDDETRKHLNNIASPFNDTRSPSGNDDINSSREVLLSPSEYHDIYNGHIAKDNDNGNQRSNRLQVEEVGPSGSRSGNNRTIPPPPPSSGSSATPSSDRSDKSSPYQFHHIKTETYNNKTINSDKKSSSSPRIKSKFHKADFERKAMNIAKLRELAEKHGVQSQSPTTSPSNNPSKNKNPSTTPNTSKSASSSTPRSNERIIQAVLGVSDKACSSAMKPETKEFIKTYASKPTSPTTVVNFSLIKDSLKDVATMSINKFMNCASDLNQVECGELLEKSGINDYKNDFYYQDRMQNYDAYRKGRGSGRSRDSRFYEEEDDEEYTYDDTNEEDGNEEHGNEEYSQNDGTSAFENSIINDGTSTLGMSVISESVVSGSIFSEVRQRQFRNEIAKKYEEDDEYIAEYKKLNQPQQMKSVGVTIPEQNDGDIPMLSTNEKRSRSLHLADPKTSNTPWDENSVSEFGDDLTECMERGLRFLKSDLMSLRDVKLNAITMDNNSKCDMSSSSGEEFQLQDPLKHNNDRGRLRSEEQEI